MKHQVTLNLFLIRLSEKEINAARSLGGTHVIGSLEVGKKAGIVVFNVSNYRFLGYRFGVNLVGKVIKNGRFVVDGGRLVYGEAY